MWDLFHAPGAEATPELIFQVPIREIAHHQTQTGAFPWEVFLSNP
jgi:hypothetical protein